MATGRIGVTPTLRTRWSKEPAGGTTSLSGLDDYSVSLVYEVGYEAVYQNGALLSRGNDYTATNGTTITLTNATVAGDIIEVFANNVVPLTDTYSQSVADGKFVNNTIVDAKGDLIVGSAADTFTRLAVGSANQVLTVDSATTSGLKWATPSSGALVFITASTFSNTASAIIDNCFTTTYDDYYVEFVGCYGGTLGDDAYFIPRDANGDVASGLYGSYHNVSHTGTVTSTGFTNAAQITMGIDVSDSTNKSFGFVWCRGMAVSNASVFSGQWQNGQTASVWNFSGMNAVAAKTYTGFKFKSSSSNVYGTIRVYGVAKS